MVITFKIKEEDRWDSGKNPTAHQIEIEFLCDFSANIYYRQTYA